MLKKYHVSFQPIVPKAKQGLCLETNENQSLNSRMQLLIFHSSGTPDQRSEFCFPGSSCFSKIVQNNPDFPNVYPTVGQSNELGDEFQPCVILPRAAYGAERGHTQDNSCPVAEGCKNFTFLRASVGRVMRNPWGQNDIHKSSNW